MLLTLRRNHEGNDLFTVMEKQISKCI